MGQGHGKDLRYCQQQLNLHYKATTSTIPAHPSDPSQRVDINEFFCRLQLAKQGQNPRTTPERVYGAWQPITLDRPQNNTYISWEDFFRSRKNGGMKAILSGGAGFGKSTLLLRVANASTKPSQSSSLRRFKLVFLVKLKRMRQSSCILDAIFDQIFPKDIRLTKIQLHKLITRYAAETLLLLDGLDEIPPRVLESQVGVYTVQDILHGRVLVDSSVLVTTRPHTINYILKVYPYYDHIKTLGFKTQTLNKYITRYFAADPNSATELISDLKSNRSLQKLANIPIIALLLCLVWKNESKLPERLTALYTNFAEVLIHLRSNEGEDAGWLMNSVLRRLGRVALNGLLDSSRARLVFSLAELDPADVQDGCRLGFLQVVSYTSGPRSAQYVTFLDKSFQEYCAAYFFANLHHADKDMFHKKLKQIHPGNVQAMEHLLRFTCGMSSGSAATELILEHVQRQPAADGFDEELHPRLQRLACLLLFESDRHDLAPKLDRPTHVLCNSQDLIALRYYLRNAQLALDNTMWQLTGT